MEQISMQIKEITQGQFVDLDKLNDQSIIVEAGAALGVIIKELRNYEQTKRCRIFAIECNKDNIKRLKAQNFHNVTIY